MKRTITVDGELVEAEPERYVIPNLETTVIDEAQEARIRHIVREELANLLPDIKRSLRQDVTDHLTRSVNARFRKV